MSHFSFNLLSDRKAIQTTAEAYNYCLAESARYQYNYTVGHTKTMRENKFNTAS